MISWVLVLASKPGAYLKSGWLVDAALKSPCYCLPESGTLKLQILQSHISCSAAVFQEIYSQWKLTTEVMFSMFFKKRLERAPKV